MMKFHLKISSDTGAILLTGLTIRSHKKEVKLRSKDTGTWSLILQRHQLLSCLRSMEDLVSATIWTSISGLDIFPSEEIIPSSILVLLSKLTTARQGSLSTVRRRKMLYSSKVPGALEVRFSLTLEELGSMEHQEQRQ